MADNHENEKIIEKWRIKKLIKSLEAAQGNGSTLISLIIPPHDQISRTTKILDDEYETASNTKNKLNQQSLMAAIDSAQQKLKLHSKIPPNGLVLYTGTIITENSKKKEITIDFEPSRPINAFIYLCDNKFHTESLNELLESDEKFGFIVMDSIGVLFGTLKGKTREVLDGFPTNLPQGRRPLLPPPVRRPDLPPRRRRQFLHPPVRRPFLRLHHPDMENSPCPSYAKKIIEMAIKCFINPATNQPNVSGLILAGPADIKIQSGQLPELPGKFMNVFKVKHGGEMGFNEAIELLYEFKTKVRFNQEKVVIRKYFAEIKENTRKYLFCVDKIMNELETGAIETLIVWEDLEISRYVLKNMISGETVIRYSKKEEERNKNEFEVEDKMCLLEWIVKEYKRFGFCLEIVSNKTEEGFEFCSTFGGFGAILCYPLDY